MDLNAFHDLVPREVAKGHRDHIDLVALPDQLA
jgi:hypothetical protein